jgi:SanA protein
MKKLILKLLITAITAMILVIIASNIIVNISTKENIYNSVEKIPKNKVGLVLGTSKYASRGRINLYYQYRLDAVVALYNANKIEFILISGDNSTKQYNEPKTIKEDLIKRGIPAEKIHLDYAGFRTFDSVIRAKEIFGLDSFTVISQEFHCERAIFIGKTKSINVVGFAAKNVSKNYGFKTNIREYFARVKMMLDLIFGEKPKFLGEEIEIK